MMRRRGLVFFLEFHRLPTAVNCCIGELFLLRVSYSCFSFKVTVTLVSRFVEDTAHPRRCDALGKKPPKQCYATKTLRGTTVKYSSTNMIL